LFGEFTVNREKPSSKVGAALSSGPFGPTTGRLFLRAAAKDVSEEDRNP
jgi:hypothetical protein